VSVSESGISRVRRSRLHAMCDQGRGVLVQWGSLLGALR